MQAVTHDDRLSQWRPLDRPETRRVAPRR